MAAASELLPDGDAGVALTIGWIRDAVQTAFSLPSVRAQSIAIANTTPPRDHLALVKACYQWVIDHVRFLDDPPGVELVQGADFTLEHRAGDCDCINSVLLPSLLGGMGIDSELVTIELDPRRPGQFSHIYARAIVDGRPVAVDAAREAETGKPAFGLEPEAVGMKRKRIWSLDPEGGYTDVQAGLGRLQTSVTRHAPGRAGQLVGRFTKQQLNGTALGRLGEGEPTGNEQYYDASTDTTYAYDANGQIVSWQGLPEMTGGGAPGSSSSLQWIQAITAAGNAAAVAIRASNQPYGAIPGYPGYQVTAGGQVIGPNGQLVARGGITTMGAGFTLSPTAMLFGGVLLVFLVLSSVKGAK